MPIDIAVVLFWVVFAINVFGAIVRRRERHLYVAIWFYNATIIAVAILYICNNLVMTADVLPRPRGTARCRGSASASRYRSGVTRSSR